MKKVFMISTATALMIGSNSALAENYSADKCQVFIKAVGASPSSHGFSSISPIVKTNWIGNGEIVRMVRFYGRVETKDLGNRASCNWSSPYQSNWQVYEPTSDPSNLSYGEVRFNFPVRSGSVAGDCPGFEWTWIGSFFVETDKNTYWVNPDFDANKNFYFDSNASDNLMKKGGWSGFSGRGLPTTREDMMYYNPGRCQ
ncbi:MAG: hypothetical protein JNM39_03450 [Bdellovibrionaceae bacterium]|nr:hypothetical protein [Pseudobdellovibrionaceae bacterium]